MDRWFKERRWRTGGKNRRREKKPEGEEAK
jgi:hypothetical protein